MKVIKATIPMLESRTLVIGFQAENQRTQVRIDCAPIFAEYPHATPSLAIKPPAGETYPVFVNRDGNEVVWTILSENLALVGDGELQLTFVKDSVIAKTIIGHIRILRSLVVDGETPDPVAQWIDDANAKLAEVDAVIVSIDEMDAVASGLPEGADPTVEVSMVNDHKRISFGIPKGDTGEKGDKGDKGDKGEVGATPQMGIGTVQTLPAGSSATASMSGTTENPLLNLGIPKGDKGDKGDRGERGPQGIQGIQGDRGLTGPRGEQGQKGDKGDTGATGATPDLSIGTVSTLPAGSSATAEITGTAENPVLSLGIPQGIQGIQGVQGVQGEKGDPGDGVPVGGLKGQVLAKALDADRVTEWINVAPVIKNTASGAIASFPDGADGHPIDELKVAIEPVQDLHGYENPWPAGGGKNKLDNTLLINPTTSIQQISLTLKPNTAYTASTNGTQPTAGVANLFFMLSGETPSSLTNGVWANHSITLTTGADGIAIVGYRDYAGTQTSIADCNNQVEEGSTATSYAPYTNICPISGFDSLKVSRTGKNLIDIQDRTLTTEGYIINQDISLPPSQYTLSYLSTTPTNLGAVACTGKDGQRCTVSITRQDSKIVAVIDAPSGIENLRVYNGAATYTNIQLELGSTASSYEPYQGETYDIAFPSEAGTVYGGELTVNEDGTGRLLVDRYFKSFTTLIGKSENADGYFWYTTSGALMIPIISGLNAKLISNRLVTEPNVSRTSFNGRLTFYANGILRWKEQDSLTLQEYRTYLANNPLEICYELAEPITYTLTASQIRTLLGQNNVWSDAGEVSVKYNADTKLYIDGKIAELVAQIVNS